MIHFKLLFLIVLLFSVSFSTTYNTPTIDGTINIALDDWDSDENMGLRPGTGGEDWYHYTTWDANYLYIGFEGFNWPDNSNNHIVGHYDFLSGGTQVGINGEALGMTADFAFQLTRVGPNGVVTFHNFNRGTNSWESTTIPWPSSEFQYNSVNDHTEFRISWATLTQGEATGPTPFVYYAAVENNTNTVTQIWPDQTDFDCGLFEAGPEFEGVSPNTDMEVVCDPPDQSLPVELTSFTVENSVEGILVKWRTESEIENLGFVLERRTESTDWQEIASYKTDGSLFGQGTTSAPTDYLFVDKLVETGHTYEYRLADISYEGEITYHSTRTITVKNNPLNNSLSKFTVLPAYPNPFNPNTTITYGLNGESNVTIQIFDIMGKQIVSLIQNSKQKQGWYDVKWNGTDYNNNPVPAGIYFSRIQSDNEYKISRLMLIK